MGRPWLGPTGDGPVVDGDGLLLTGVGPVLARDGLVLGRSCRGGAGRGWGWAAADRSWAGPVGAGPVLARDGLVVVVNGPVLSGLGRAR